MSYRKDRENFIRAMARISADDIAWRLLKEATTLNRISELQCSSEWADRDRVPCPGSRKGAKDGDCLCSYDPATDTHSDVPRVDVKGQQAERRVLKAITMAGPSLEVEFQGDPRGWPIKVRLKGETGRGIGVPNGPSGIRW